MKDEAGKGNVKLRQKAEKLVQEKNKSQSHDIGNLSREEAGRIIHELRVHQLELELQNQELRLAQEELDAARKRYFNLYDLAPVGYVTVTENGIIQEANLTAANMLGAPRGSLSGKALRRFIPFEEQDIYYRHMQSLIKTGLPQAFELRMQKKDGDSFWVSLEAGIEKFSSESQPLCLVVLSDITRRKQAEEENRRINLLVETAGRIAKFGGWSVKLSYNKVYMSSQVAAIHEAPPGYAPTVEEAINFYAPEWREKIFRVFKRCATEGVPFDEEMEIITLKGNRIWIRTTGEPIRDEKGEIRQIAGALQDISERRRTSQALQVSLKEKETLLQEVHHRVKNNLAVVSALLDMQRQEVDDPGAVAVLSDLTTRIRSIVLVHEHLYQSKDVAGIDLQDYFSTLLEDLKSSMGLQNNIHCEVRAQGIKVGLDIAVPCGMLVNELVINAIKHAFPDGKTHDGQSEPEIKVTMHAEDRLYRIVVSDNGVGFPGDVDLDSSDSFGLRLVRMIGTHQLGGRLELDRTRGTCIIFTFGERNSKIPGETDDC